MNETMRVISLASDKVKPGDEILMWSHYTNKQAGMRIGFEFPEAPSLYKIKPMIYRDDRVALDTTSNTHLHDQGEIMDRVMRTKCTSWAYENEYRLITASFACYRKPSPHHECEFLQIAPEWVRRIDFGLRHKPSERQRTVEFVKANYQHAKIYQVELHQELFALQYTEIK